ncbi:magnesium transporter [Microvirga terricola]|uniref:Magnesium transporter MgtE n=1 Tax=Microvirga terricola TaxID=2719797 RepID=A0ABX0VFI1_9HYPH|nr:magnesium transporter [Microvirga terricola]NIX78266.1 magnesium transporter [Microvirga terricola]
MQDKIPAEVILDPVVNAAGLAHEHVADIAEALNGMPTEAAAEILLGLPTEQAIEVLDQPDLESADELIAALPDDRATALLMGMSADRVAGVFRQMEEPRRSTLLERLDPETKQAVKRLLTYPPGTAGSIMTTEFVSAPKTWTVEQTLDHIRRVERTRETVYAIYILDPRTQKLVQTVSLRRLIAGEPHAPVLSVATPRRPVTVSPLADQEDVARLISKYDLLAVPVVERGRVIGIVTVDDIIDAIVEESTEDVQKFGGMEALTEPYMQIGFVEMIRKRAGWLCALFLSEMLTASAMQHFESELERAIVLTLFIPLIMSSGGNSGSQATSLIIRALALQEVRLREWWRVVLRELPTGVTLGAILGTIGATRIALWQWFGFYDYGEHWMLIALTVAATLVGIVTFGSLAGSMLPFILQRIGYDPASASAPFVATLVDVTGLVIYFSVALAILSGTLL